MKCLKNAKTNEIIRVDDKTAYQMAGNIWKYIAKVEWKIANGKVKSEVSEEVVTEKVKSKKQLRKEKVEE